MPAFSPIRRRPRVLVGHYTPIVRGPDLEPIPQDEWVAVPVYVYDHDAIDRDCDSYGRGAGADPAKVEERRARLHRELDADMAGIAAVSRLAKEG